MSFDTVIFTVPGGLGTYLAGTTLVIAYLVAAKTRDATITAISMVVGCCLTGILGLGSIWGVALCVLTAFSAWLALDQLKVANLSVKSVQDQFTGEDSKAQAKADKQQKADKKLRKEYKSYQKRGGSLGYKEWAFDRERAAA